MHRLFYILIMATALLSSASCSPEPMDEWVEMEGGVAYIPDGGMLIYEIVYDGWDYLVNDSDKTVSVTLQNCYSDPNDMTCFDLAPGATSEKLKNGAYIRGNSLRQGYKMSVMMDGELVCECVNRRQFYHKEPEKDWEVYFYSDNYQSEIVYEYFIDKFYITEAYPNGVKIKLKEEQRIYHIDEKLLQLYAHGQKE